MIEMEIFFQDKFITLKIKLNGHKANSAGNDICLFNWPTRTGTGTLGNA